MLKQSPVRSCIKVVPASERICCTMMAHVSPISFIGESHWYVKFGNIDVPWQRSFVADGIEFNQSPALQGYQICIVSELMWQFSFKKRVVVLLSVSGWRVQSGNIADQWCRAWSRIHFQCLHLPNQDTRFRIWKKKIYAADAVELVRAIPRPPIFSRRVIVGQKGCLNKLCGYFWSSLF